jgi:hypothetical protein
MTFIGSKSSTTNELPCISQAMTNKVILTRSQLAVLLFCLDCTHAFDEEKYQIANRKKTLIRALSHW